MASANTLCAEIINVKGTVVTNHEFYNDSDGIKHLRIHVRPNKWHENDCPICHRKCAGTVYRRKRVRGVHLISAKFSLSSYLRHTMYYAGNTAVI